MKKTTAIICTLLIGATSAFGLAACQQPDKEEGKQDNLTVMNVSLNPEVEFILNADNKVVSVNALNEEGNLIISAEAFESVEGKTAEEAAVLFVEVSKETGYLVSGTVNAGENEVSFSFSGDEEKATELYNEIKADVTAYLESVDVTATIGNVAAITEAEIEALLAECAPYLDTAKMEYAEMINALAESRQETAEFYSQELKTAYYEAKAFAMEQAELEVMREQLNVVQKAVFDGMTLGYETAIGGIELTRKTLLVDETSPYQIALKAFREAKVDYLNYRNEVSIGDIQISIEVTSQLENLETLVEQAEAAIIKAGEDAHKSLDTMKENITAQYTQLVAWLEEEAVKAEEYLPEIAEKRQQAQTAFFEEFEKNYAAAITAAETNWADMAAALQANDAE